MPALDEIDRQLIAALQINARESVAMLARQLGIARTTVTSRLARLEKTQVITGYGVRLGQRVVDGGLQAYVGITVQARSGKEVLRRLSAMAQVQQLCAVSGEQCVAAGNMLANPGVIEAMVTAFETTSGHLADRLLAAMHAGVAGGGEAGPVHSAALVIVDDLLWPIVNLRVDWADEDPIGALDHLWQAYRGQLQAYIDRAINPQVAPGYAVPGDDR